MTRGDSRSAADPPAPAPPAEARDPGPHAAAIVLIVVLSLGFVSALLGPTLRDPPEASLVDGSWTAAFGESLMEDTILREAAITVWSAIDFVVFRQGLPGVLVGEDGWLFTTEEFAPAEVEDRFTVEAPVQRVTSVSRRLAEDDVDLLVVLVPAKARMQTEALGRHTLPEDARARYGVLRSSLEDAGVTVIDGAAAMAAAQEEDDVFLRTDTHWTPTGAAAVAEAVVDRTRARHGEADWLGETPYRVEDEGEVTVEGDLLAYVPLGPLADRLGPPPDRIPRRRVAPADGGSADPFAEVRLPVTLVGTSYSADERWGFAGRLRAGLGSDVLVAASEGEGPFEPMETYLEGEAYRGTPPDVVVWEIPERYAWPEVGW